MFSFIPHRLHFKVVSKYKPRRSSFKGKLEDTTPLTRDNSLFLLNVYSALDVKSAAVGVIVGICGTTTACARGETEAVKGTTPGWRENLKRIRAFMIKRRTGRSYPHPLISCRYSIQQSRLLATSWHK